MRRIVTLVITVIFVVALATSVFAHGHRGGAQRAYDGAICVNESCPNVGQPIGDNATCYAHYYGDGHGYARAGRCHR